MKESSTAEITACKDRTTRRSSYVKRTTIIGVPMRTWTIAIVLAARIALCTQPFGAAQITELREYHGKHIQEPIVIGGQAFIACTRSGLFSFEMPCGLESWYEDIFVGTVLSVSDTEGSERVLSIAPLEKVLSITPEEIFSGNPPDQLKVTTSQGDCLGDITPGDKWLFYLRRDTKTGTLKLAYGSPSGPVADEEETISLLRRLIKMTDAGVIRGYVVHPVRGADHTETQTHPSNHKIVAKRVEDGKDYVAFTNQDGAYEFALLPAGSYDLSANTTEGLWAEEGRVRVQPRGCSSVKFELSPDSSISGFVTNANGKPLKYASIEIGPLDGQPRWGLTTADEHGFFEVKGLEPGRYLVGIDIQDNQAGLRPRAKAYFPGVRDRDLAVAIALGQGEKRTHIDFSLPKPEF
jgi:hypothetical protein